ncbi:MAG: PAS domain-containing protein [Desulfamplus sp.]|nr:PAS domain-containing protein [Desulfamplus sp.]
MDIAEGITELKTLNQKIVELENLLDHHLLLENQFRQNAESLKLLADSLPDIICRVDYEGIFKYVSPAIGDYGFNSLELIGKHFNILQEVAGVPPATCLLWGNIIKKVFSTRKMEIIEHNSKTPNGNMVYFETRMVPEFGKDGSVVSVLTIDRDITDSRTKKNQLIMQIEELRTENKSLRESLENFTFLTKRQ